MRIFRLAGFIACALLLAGGVSSQAQADAWNQKTFFTFSGPVEIPGPSGQPTVLPAGTYVFKLLDSLSDRDIVQIFNKNQTHLYATILAIPDYRLKPASKSVIQFTESPTGSPEAVKAWFYPGDDNGQEFVYPKARAIELAKANNEPVLSMPEETATNMKEPATTAKAPSVQAMEKAPVMAEKPNGEEVPSTQVVESKPNKPATIVAQNNSNELPKTASEMPLALLLGSILIGAAVGLRAFSQKLSRN